MYDFHVSILVFKLACCTSFLLGGINQGILTYKTKTKQGKQLKYGDIRYKF